MVNKAQKTRVLMENFNKYMTESNNTPLIVDTKPDMRNAWRTYDLELEEFQLNGKYIDFAEIFVGVNTDEGNLSIEDIWMKLENGKYQYITSSLDEESQTRVLEMIQTELDDEAEYMRDQYDED